MPCPDSPLLRSRASRITGLGGRKPKTHQPGAAAIRKVVRRKNAIARPVMGKGNGEGLAQGAAGAGFRCAGAAREQGIKAVDRDPARAVLRLVGRFASGTTRSWFVTKTGNFRVSRKSIRLISLPQPTGPSSPGRFRAKSCHREPPPPPGFSDTRRRRLSGVRTSCPQRWCKGEGNRNARGFRQSSGCWTAAPNDGGRAETASSALSRH
jgi:hypothetical protein